mmetsp:Transcript_45767/g.133272  ORF Transcript_45767/g.133272 Transcript_45767/m.133272 type:complete len:173 (+) Transcript_45767:2-520(+)
MTCQDLQMKKRLVSLSVRYKGRGCAFVEDRASAQCADVVASGGEVRLLSVTDHEASVTDTENWAGGAQVAALNGTYVHHSLSPDARSVLLITRAALPVLWSFAHGWGPRLADLGAFFPLTFSDDGEVLVGRQRLIDMATGAQVRMAIGEHRVMWQMLHRVSRLRCSGPPAPG